MEAEEAREREAEGTVPGDITGAQAQENVQAQEQRTVVPDGVTKKKKKWFQEEAVPQENGTGMAQAPQEESTTGEKDVQENPR